jgi:hypothetical protein
VFITSSGRHGVTAADRFTEVVDGFFVIAFGTPMQRKRFFGESITVSASDRLRAMVELRDSGPGRPVPTMEIDERAQVPAFILPPGSQPSVQ